MKKWPVALTAFTALVVPTAWCSVPKKLVFFPMEKLWFNGCLWMLSYGLMDVYYFNKHIVHYGLLDVYGCLLMDV